MAIVVTVRWHTPPPSPIDERLIVDDGGHAWLEVLRPRTPGDTVGTYEGAVEEAEIRELTAAGSDVELDVVDQDPRLAAVVVTADRVAQRLLATPLAVAQFFAPQSARSRPSRRRLRLVYSEVARSRSSSSSISLSVRSNSALAGRRFPGYRCLN